MQPASEQHALVRRRTQVHTECDNTSVDATVPNTEGPSGCAAASLKSHFRMDFFSCPCLLSEAADWIKAIGFPQTLRVINISAAQDAKHCRSTEPLRKDPRYRFLLLLPPLLTVSFTLCRKKPQLWSRSPVSPCVGDLSCFVALLFSTWRRHLSAARCIKQPCKKNWPY